MRKPLYLLGLLPFLPAAAETDLPLSENLFYLTDSEDSYESFEQNVDQISIVGPQVYKVNATGVVWGQVDRRVLDLARQKGVKVMPLIVNPGFDQPMFHELLQDVGARRRTINQMVQLAKEHGYYGWQFDFENIHVSDRDLLTAFYREAAEALHQEGFKISIAAVPRMSEDPGPTEYHRWIFEYWRGAYDLKVLGEVGDFISLMTYDQHTRRTPPGPIAGLPWVEEAVQYALGSGVPAERISLGLPLYSNYWYANYNERMGGHSWGQPLPYARAKGFLDRFQVSPEWLEKDGCFYAFWENAGLFEYLYLEEKRSFEAKLEMLSKYSLKGISVWRLGQEDPQIWEVLKKGVRTQRL